jgi:hypothetical protein
MTNSTIPPIASGLTGDALIAAINDRLRRVQQAIQGVQDMITVNLTEIVLSVPGTLAINSNAAPLVSLPSAGTPSAIVALIKTAPTGSGVTFAVYAGGSTLIGTGTIAAGATSVTVSTGLAAIAANAVLTLAITAVGSGTAGSDLSILVRF